MSKKIRIILDNRSLDMTPYQFVKKNALTVSSPVVECVRHEKDPLVVVIRVESGLSFRSNNILLEAKKTNDENKPTMEEYRRLDSPFARIKTFRCLFAEFERALSDREKETKSLTQQNNRDDFEKRYGRVKYPGEPEEGFRVPFFRPTPTDDGTVVVNGRVLPGPEEKFGELLFNETFLQENSTDLPYMRNLTREEFKTRYEYPFETRRSLAEIEQFFDRKLDSKTIQKIFENLGREYVVCRDSHPKTGAICLLIVKESGFYRAPQEDDEDKYVIVGAQSKKEYDLFVGRALIGGLLAQGIGQKKEDVER